MENQIQCANCYCTLYYTGENGASGVTGELCLTCQIEKEEKERAEEQEEFIYRNEEG